MSSVNMPSGGKTQQLFSDTEYSLGAGLLQGFLAGAVLKGYDPQALLKKAGLSPTLYTDPKGRIDGEQLQRLLTTISTEMDDLFIGFMDVVSSASYRDKFHDPVDLSNKLYEDVMRLGLLYGEKVTNDIVSNCFIDLRRDLCTWYIQYNLRKGVDERLFYWYRLVAHLKMFSEATGKRVQLKQAWFSFPEPDAEEGFDFRIFNCPVLFNQPVCALVFDRRYLKMPFANQATTARHYQNWFALPGQYDSYARQVEDALQKLQNQGVWTPTLEQIADKINVRPRALRRHLAAEGETFLAIRNRVRYQLAMKLLASSDTPINEIANQVGFAESGDFARAFRSWAGCTPSAYRAKNKPL